MVRWTVSIVSLEMPGNIQNANVPTIGDVLEDENCSVEKKNIKPAHATTGSQFLILVLQR